MKGLVCKVCGYVALDGKTDICPVYRLKNVFIEKEDAYKTPDFKAETGESEKKHIPQIAVIEKCGLIPGAGCIDVHVKVGEIIHPMQIRDKFLNEQKELLEIAKPLLWIST